MQPDDFNFESTREDDAVKIQFKMEIEKIPSFTAGSKMFLSPRIYKLSTGQLPSPEGRIKSYYFSYPFIKRDTTIYFLPVNYKADHLPSPKDISSDFGILQTQYLYDEKSNTITSITLLKLNHNIIPADKFAEVFHFFEKVIVSTTKRWLLKEKRIDFYQT